MLNERKMNAEAVENCLCNRHSMKAIAEVEKHEFRPPKIALITGISGQVFFFILLIPHDYYQVC